jgi:hypothetical protein
VAKITLLRLKVNVRNKHRDNNQVFITQQNSWNLLSANLNNNKGVLQNRSCTNIRHWNSLFRDIEED